LVLMLPERRNINDSTEDGYRRVYMEKVLPAS
jgi:hypothetical protein